MQTFWMWLLATSQITQKKEEYSSVFEFKDIIDIHEQTQDLAKYKGNVTLVVNVASY